MSTWTDPVRIKAARSRHMCTVCGRWIEPGEPYSRQRGYDGGDAWTFKMCQHCEAVSGIWDPRDDDNCISMDGFMWWAEADGQLTIAEARAVAGWRNRWRTRSGALWPVPTRNAELEGDDRG